MWLLLSFWSAEGDTHAFGGGMEESIHQTWSSNKSSNYDLGEVAGGVRLEVSPYPFLKNIIIYTYSTWSS